MLQLIIDYINNLLKLIIIHNNHLHTYQIPTIVTKIYRKGFDKLLK